MTQATPRNYWIDPNALRIDFNSLGNPDYIQASCMSNAVIMCFMDGIPGLGYDAGHNYRRWRLVAYPTVFATHSPKYVYVAIPRNDETKNAVVVFPSDKIDIYGYAHVSLEGGDEELVQIGSADYYYIDLQGMITASGDNGTTDRAWDDGSPLQFGLLDSADARDNPQSEWYEYSSVSRMVTFLQDLTMKIGTTFFHLYAKTVTLVTGGSISFPSGAIVDSVATSSSTASDSTTGSNSQIATTGFLLGPFLAWLRGKFVRKDSTDTQVMQGALQAPTVKANSLQHVGNEPVVIGTEQFVPSTQGSALFKDNGKEHLQIGNLTILGRMNVKEVSIQEVNYIGGAQVLSGADGFTIKHVDTYVDGSKYRVWFDINDDANHLASTWRAGDLAYSEKWNFRTGTSTGQVQRRWWRLVLAFGEQVPTTFANDGSKMGYLILSATDCESGSDTPTVGDKVVMLGHKPQTGEEAGDYENRQNAILLFSTGTGAPFIRVYTGIEDYSLEDAICPIDLSPSNIQLLAEKIKIAGTSALGSNTTLASVIDNISHVNEQLDGSFQIWQGETTDAPLPNANYNANNVQEWLQSTANEPASEWTTTKDKAEHLGDFYITSDGRCYMYVTENDLFFWRLVEDQYLTAYVNEIGAKARVFTSSPIGTSLPYKQGDMWVNATYPTSGSITYNGNTYTASNPLFSNDIVVARRDKTGTLGSIEDWQLSNNYKEDVAAFASTIQEIASRLDTQTDGVIDTYYVNTVSERDLTVSIDWDGDTDAGAEHNGDQCYVAGNDTLYVWRKTGVSVPLWDWFVSNDAITKQVIKNAKDAKDTADGKRRVFVGGTPQPPYDEGDLWVNASASENNQVVFADDIAKCTTSKGKNGTFALSDWSSAAGYGQSIRDLASDGVITDAEKENLKRFLMNAENEYTDAAARYGQYSSSAAYYDENIATSTAAHINLQPALTGYQSAYTEVKNKLTTIVNYSGSYRLDGQGNRMTKTSYGQLFDTYYTAKETWDTAISKAILHYVNVYTVQGALLSTPNGIEMVTQLLKNGAYAGVQSEIGALVEQGADGQWYSLARMKADRIELEGYTSINNGFSVDENGDASMTNATINGLLSRGAKYLTPLNIQSAVAVVPTYLEATSGASLVNILELPLDRLGNYTYIYDGKDDVNNMWSGVGYPMGYDNYKTYKGESATGYLISAAEEVIKKFLLESKSIDFDSQSSGYNMFVDAEIGTGHGCPTIVLPCFEVAAIYSSGTYQEWLGDAFETYYETWCNVNNAEQQDDWTNDAEYMDYVWRQRGKRMYDARKWVGAEIDIYLIGACAIDVIGVYDSTEEVPDNATGGFFETSLHNKCKYTYRFEVEPKNIGCTQGNCKKLHLKCYEESILVDTVDMGGAHENRYASVVRWNVAEEVVYNIDKYVMGLEDRE